MLHRIVLVTLGVVFVAGGCAKGDDDPSDDMPMTAAVVTTTAPATTRTAASNPSTAPPSSSSTTTAAVSFPADPSDHAWSGLEFSAGTNLGWVDGEFGRLDTWVADPGALHNVGSMTVQLLVKGEPIGLWPWHQGSFSLVSGPPSIELVVVGTEPNPYAPGEYEELVEGVEPVAPDPSTLHSLAVWAVRELDPGRYVVTDVAPLERTGHNMGYAALVNVSGQYDLCVVDASMTDDIYAYFDHDDPETEAFYPATLGFTVAKEGELDQIVPSLVSCILAPDWDTRGY